MASSLKVNGTLVGAYSGSDIELEASDLAVKLDADLTGITGSFALDSLEHFDKMEVLFDLKANAFEDIPITLELWREFMYGAHVQFYACKPGTYNYENMACLFQIQSGIQYEDMPAMFSIIKTPQAFEAYVLQKTYNVTTELFIQYGDVEIQDWNVKPNQTWYIMVDGYSVSLYSTLADLQANTNVVATGTADSATLRAVLAYASSGEELDYYYQDVAYHLTLSAYSSIGKHYFKLKPMTDLSEIRHPIYNNPSLVEMRGEAELDLHTYAVLKREVTLGVHFPEMEPGEIIYDSSTRRGKSRTAQILSHTINGSIDSDGSAYLVNTVRLANYMELKR